MLWRSFALKGSFEIKYKMENQEALVSRVWTALEYNLVQEWSSEMKGEGNRGN